MQSRHARQHCLRCSPESPEKKGLRFNTETVAPAAQPPRRPHPAPAGPAQLRRQCPQVHRTGHITLRAKLTNRPTRPPPLRFEVEDTGIGIAPEALPKLFARLRAGRQLDHAQVRRHRAGPGDHPKARRTHGRHHRCNQHPGQGSSFWFTAVLRKGGSPTTHRRGPAAKPAERMILRDHAGQRILLAEDEPINREIARMLLEDVGLAVDLAEDGP